MRIANCGLRIRSGAFNPQFAIRNPQLHIIGLALLSLVTSGTVAQVSSDEWASEASVREAFARDHGRICGFGSRFAGQAGADATADFLEAELRAAGVGQVWRQPVELVVPVTESCTIRVGDEPPVPLYPVWPNGANPSVTPPGGITGKAVYIGEGEHEALPVEALAGAVAVMEFNTGSRWQYAAMYGASAVIFLAPGETSWAEANEKYTYVSAPLPRFYVDDPELCERLRRTRPAGAPAATARLEPGAPAATVTLDAHVRWRRRVAQNVVGYIPGSDPARADRVVVLHARYDACCVVPDLAFGAEQAINPAAALHLMRRFAARPPAYSVLVAFTCGDTFELAASRRLMRTLTATQQDIRRDVADAGSELEALRAYREALEPDNGGARKDSRTSDADKGVGARRDSRTSDLTSDLKGDLAGAVIGRAARGLRTEHVLWQVRMQMLRVLDELKRVRRQGGDETQLAALNARCAGLLRLEQHLHHEALDDDDVAVLTELLPAIQRRLERMIADRTGRLERQRVDLAMLEAAGLGRGVVGDYARGILFVSLELSSHGRRFGPFAQSGMCDLLVQNQLVRYGTALREIADAFELPEHVRATYLDDTAEGRRHWQSDLPFPVVNGIDAAVSAGCLGMMFATTQDMRRWVDTPLDTAERVDVDRLAPQLVMLDRLLDAALRDAPVGGEADVRRPRGAGATPAGGRHPTPIEIVGSRLERQFWKLKGVAALISPGEGQLDLGLPDVLVYGKTYLADKGFGVRGIGVRDMTFHLTDGEGVYSVDDVMNKYVRPASMLFDVFQMDEAGRVTMAMDDNTRGAVPIRRLTRDKDWLTLRGEMFRCAQIGLFGLHDPRYLEDLDDAVIVDASRGSEVRTWHTMFDRGVGNVCVPAELDRWQLVLAKGDSARRMVMLNASAEKPEGAGYPLDWRQRWPVAFTSARDFARLNALRLDRLENTGVVDPFLRAQHERSQEEAGLAEAARDEGDGAEAWRRANEALTVQAQVYQKTRRAADDTIRAALVLLVGLVPFCYFVERLVIGAAGVYRQIGGFAAIFAGMAALVGGFHPAFRISMTPVTILLAFTILLLSAVVSVIVLGKFLVELKRLRGRRRIDEDAAPEETQDAPASDSFSRLDVVHRAMLLGVSNLRRRRMRTGLTLATLVLISFVIMSFTNPRTHLHPLKYEVARLDDGVTGKTPVPQPAHVGATAVSAVADGGERPQTTAHRAVAHGRVTGETPVPHQSETPGPHLRHAVMNQRMSWDAMPAWTLDHLRTSYGDRAAVAGHWWITLNDLRTQYPKTVKLTGPGGRYGLVSAVACIEPLEAEAVGLTALMGEAGVKAFATRDDALVVSGALAERLGVQAGGRVEMFGSTFTVAAVVDQQAMLSLAGLNGKRYAPVDYYRYPRMLQEQIDVMEESRIDADVTSMATAEAFRQLAPDQFAIIRAVRAGEFAATLRAVVLVPKDPADTMPLAESLAERIHQPVFAADGGRVVLCAAAEVTRLTGLGNVVVPLLIGGLIILSTMLNAVYERRREIGIFMAVGLAPAHVGALFLAEAAALGTIGVVGGYILGQGLGTVAATYDVIPGLRLNFSSAAAVYTQVAILGVVLVSTIWPARVARRIAAPGSEATWKLPAPDGDVLSAALPFTMNGRDAAAVLAYLREWLAAHTESTMGRFCTGGVEPFAESVSGARGLVAQVWLAPFDLGILQTMELEIRPGGDPAIHEVRIALRREAGPKSVWLRSNRRFLSELRKRFLLWRSIGPAEAERYRRASATMFTGAISDLTI